MARATRWIFACAFLLIGATWLPGGAAYAQDRAQEVLTQARAAAAGKAGLDKVTSLTMGATVRRVVQQVGMELNSNVQIEVLFPDKYRRTEEISIGPMTRTVITGLNGDDLLYDDGGAAAMVGIDPKAPGPMRDDTIKSLKEDAFRMTTLLLLAPPAHLACTVTSGGVAEAPDGKADVVDVKGPNGLNLRMFFDTVSHQLLLASYITEAPDAEQVKALTQKLTEKAKADPANMKQAMQEMRDEVGKLPKKALTVQMHFAEHKKFDGVTMPSRMTVDGGAQGQEEWTFTSFKVNPSLKPERFVK